MSIINDLIEWERSVVLKLKLEHSAVCRERKVKLRPVAVELFDSNTKWGQFDALTRTILISRRLVREFAWHQVLGVLRHEMAHQLVAESSPFSSGQKPHDAAFKEACKRLGVPDQYAKAGVDLTECTLDWRTEKRDEESERILEKVRKLLVLATSTNEHEALLAMERVREIYARYNLQNFESASAAGNRREHFVHAVITRGKKRHELWERKVMGILNEHFFVETIMAQEFDAKSGEYHRIFEIIGSRENVLMAEYVYHFLLNQLELLLQQAAAARPYPLSQRERNSYRLGILEGFSDKLKKSETNHQAARTHASPTPSSSAIGHLSTVGKALECFRQDQQLERYLKDIYPRMVFRRQAVARVDVNAYSAGMRAGKTITLHKPVGTQRRDGERLFLPEA